MPRLVKSIFISIDIGQIKLDLQFLIIIFHSTGGPFSRGLFICEFDYSQMKFWSRRSNFQSKCVFLSANFRIRGSK